MSEIQHRDALKAGHRLHWYAVERILGQGGFGITYLARDTNLDQLVAIKEFLPAEIAVRTDDLSVQPRTGSDSDQYQWGLSRFLSEARILAQFDHPNIVRIFSVFEANHTAYLVMRYEHGVSFNDYLERHKHLSEEELLDILLPILDGLKLVHAAGFIHRDIQPANIFIRNDGAPVLLDFGAAREAAGKPRTMTILIAPGYAPFEQYYSSSKEQGPWTDIYALAATMYRAIAGVAPIDAIERSRGMLGSTRDLLVPATVIGESRYSKQFLSAIDHGLKFNEKDRPRSLVDWLSELQPAAGSETRSVPASVADPGVKAGPVASTPPLTMPGTRNSPYLRALSMVVIFVLGTGLGMILLKNYDGQSTPVFEDTVPAANITSSSPEIPDLEAGLPETAGLSPAANAPDIKPNVTGSEPGNTTAAAGENIAIPGPQPADLLLDKVRELEQRISDQNVLVEGIVSKGEEEKEERRKLADLRNELDKLEGTRLEEQRKINELQQQRKQAEIEIQNIRTTGPPPEKVVLSETGKAQPPARDNPLQPALDAYNAGDYQTALTLLRPLADRGEPVAKYHLAVMYRNGLGILANNNQARNWMISAAGDGQTDAQVALARMYSEGINGVQDPFLAYTWYLVAEKNGIFNLIDERRKVEDELQPEQLPQAAALAAQLHNQQGLNPAGKSMRN